MLENQQPEENMETEYPKFIRIPAERYVMTRVIEIKGKTYKFYLKEVDAQPYNGSPQGTAKVWTCSVNDNSPATWNYTAADALRSAVKQIESLKG